MVIGLLWGFLLMKRIIVLLCGFMGGFALGMEEKALIISNINLSLPTSRPDRYTTLEVGQGLRTPDQIVESLRRSDVKKVVGSVDFGGHQFYQVFGEMTKRLQKPDNDEEKLIAAAVNVNKRILATASYRTMIDKFVAAGGEARISPVHCKGWALKKEDSSVIESIVTSANLSARANNNNIELVFTTTDSPVKNPIAGNIQDSFGLGVLYLGDGVIPTTPEKIKQMRKEAFQSGVIPEFEDLEYPLVMSSATSDIAAFRKAQLQEVIDSKEKDKEGYLSTMTLGLEVADALSQVDFPFTLVLDKSGVTQQLKPKLEELAAKDNFSILAFNRNDGIEHDKLWAFKNGGRVMIEASTQNNTDSSGCEFNQSIAISSATYSPIKAYAQGMKNNSDYVQFTTSEEFEKACPRKKRTIKAKKQEMVATITITPTKNNNTITTNSNNTTTTTVPSIVATLHTSPIKQQADRTVGTKRKAEESSTYNRSTKARKKINFSDKK